MQTLTKGRLLAGSILDKQIELETDAIDAGVRRYRDLARKAETRGDGASLKPAERMLLHWLTPMVANIKAEVRAVRACEPGVARGKSGPMMLMVDPDKLAVITIREVLSSCMAQPGGVNKPKLFHRIGRAVIAQASLDILKKDHPDSLKELGKTVRTLTPANINHWSNKHLAKPIFERQVAIHTGAKLLSLLLDVASADSYDRPFKLAFHHRDQRDGKKIKKYLVIDEAVLDIIEDGHAVRQFLRPRYLPMVVHPYKWSSDVQGGYVRIRTPLMSKATREQKEAITAADMSQVYECLDDVCSTQWRVNQKILDTVKQIWEDGGEPAIGIARRDDGPRPARPAAADTDKAIKKAWKRECSQWYRSSLRSKADRVELLHRMDVADRMTEFSEFYCPHQFDFRGRCYPLPAHLNHHGNDLARGVLEFAHGRELTVEGHRWLRINVANEFGIDKVSFDDRVQWTRDMQGDIDRVIRDPVNCDFWRRAENPWQFLAACLALNDPEAGAHLPVRNDGTCNGLQHYAALVRDADGAARVNMVPGTSPSGVYNDVADAVENQVAEDAQMGHPNAVALASLINKKLVKSPTMTTLYGVTMVGIRGQLCGTLREAGFADDSLYQASKYLTSIVPQAIGQVCKGAREVMDWLMECARLSTDADSTRPIRWTTPIGLPVVQPYRNFRRAQIKTVMQYVTLCVDAASVPIKVSRQRSAFAPNFIHSLDATHMLTTARACRKDGIAFAGVHDSYWTHASDNDVLNRNIREQFVALHSLPILDRLRDELSANAGKTMPAPPPSGSFDLNQVLTSPYFFN